MKTDPIENHRGREGGVLVYPVISRRSGGLSIGINLFPDRKRCSFDCPYCEVFPFKTNAKFSCEIMETDLRDVIKRSNEQRVLVKDICFSGNGEPTMSPHFSAALESAARIRDTSAPGAALVLITNGTGLLDESIFTLLKNAATGKQALAIWLKLDAGTSEWYKKMDRSAVPYNELIAKIKEFVTLAPLTIQTMLCAIDGKAPPPGEVQAWETLVLELVKTSARGPGIRSFQLYGKARPAPEDPLAESLPASYLEERAASLRTALTGAGLKKGSGETIPVEVFY